MHQMYLAARENEVIVVQIQGPFVKS
jgi:hypothetical protein